MEYLTKDMLKKLTAFVLFLIVVAISACSPQAEPTPTQSSEFVVRELPSPTFTPIPSATFTPSPSNTSTPTSEPTATFTPSPTPDPGPELIEIGRSINNAPIEAIRFGYGSHVVLLIGGIHAGFAPSTVHIAEKMAEYFTNDLTVVPLDVTVYVIPNANPDTPFSPGNLAGRLNVNGVDLNRNWDCRWLEDARFRGEVVKDIGGAQPFSEPETQVIKAFIEEVSPSAVVFWEAKYPDGFISPGRCDRRSDVSFALAERYAQAAEYQVDDFEIDTGQILNGDGTNWLDSQGIPAIAVLLPDYDEIDWEYNLQGILAVLKAGQ